MKDFKKKVHQLGGPFAETENVYFSQGRDWLSAAYKPKYPEETPGDLIIHVSRGKPTLMASGIMNGGVTIHCADWDDLIDLFKEVRKEHERNELQGL